MAAGGDLDHLERIIEGYDNEVYRVSTIQGDDVVARIRRFGGDLRAAQREAEAIEQARAGHGADQWCRGPALDIAPVRTEQDPGQIPVRADVRLRRFHPVPADDRLLRELLVWYQDLETVRLVDGPGAGPYDLDRLRAMFAWMNDHGELYLVERRDPPGGWWPIGDACLQRHAIPIVLAPGHRGRGIGRAVIGTLICRARGLGWESIHISDIYRYNVASQRLFESLGFVSVDDTEHGRSYRLDIS